jgi:hypothetical protein
MKSLLEVLMGRDGLTKEEAQELIAAARAEVLEDGCDPEEVLYCNFGLEPDYVLGLLGEE